MHPERNKKFLILEDDVIFNLEDYDPVLRAIPRDFDWVSLGTQTRAPWPKRLEDKIKFERSEAFSCTHAYILTPNSASKILSLIQGKDMWTAVDVFAAKYIYPKTITYVSTWPLIGQRTIKYTTPESKIEWPSLLSPEHRANQ
jgi:GR25 family glycosyltransferase involved in LPS biosynthesis